MTKVDQRSVVPPVDAAARERLAAALDRTGVVAASLTGSQASESAGPLSDIDVGVWLEPALSSDERAAIAGGLGAAAMHALGTSEVDLVVLNDAPPLLRHRALRDGRRILDRVPRDRVRLETEAILDYLDTAALRRTLAAGMRQRIQEGRFGRR